MKADKRAYNSPARQAGALATRERILESLAEWLQTSPGKEFTLEALATSAGIEKRTILRHFQSKEALQEAFWQWINQRITPAIYPSSLSELISAPRATFASFDEQEGIIRASLHTEVGRSMRMSVVEARRAAFKKVAESGLSKASSEQIRRFETLAHLLYSAAAWETLRDYAGISGEEAGEAASWALDVLARFISDSK